MPLQQLTDTHREPLDLWLSPNHEGTRLRGAREALKKRREPRFAPVPTIQALPAAAQRRVLEVRPPAALRTPAAQRLFCRPCAVFVGRPSAALLCPQCRDVFLDPVIASDGATYCRKCVPALGDDDEGGVDSHDALGRDLAMLEQVSQLQVLCKNGLQMNKVKEGAAGADTALKWTYDPEGCNDYCTLGGREAHEEGCDYELLTCGLPHSDVHADNCTARVRRVALEEHRAVCQHRLQECSNLGCGRLIQTRKLTEHVVTCGFKQVTCANDCGWRGIRAQLVEHRANCPLETITCGREDSEDPTACCTFQTERRHLQVHEPECEFRLTPCQYCDRPVSYRHIAMHEMHCFDRKDACERCGRLVYTRRMEEHRTQYCSKGLYTCEFAKYGCTERSSRDELKQHAQEDAHRHLRLVMLAVEQMAEEYQAWYADVKTIKEDMTSSLKKSATDVDTNAQRIRGMRAKSETELTAMRSELTSVRNMYDDEVSRLAVQVGEIRADSEAKLKDLAAENATLRSLLEERLTRREADEVRAEAAKARERTLAELEDARGTTVEHVRRWELDVVALREETATAKEMADEKMNDVLRRVEQERVNEAHRSNDLWEQVRELQKTTTLELERLSSQQLNVETRLAEANEKLRVTLAPSAGGQDGGLSRAGSRAGSRPASAGTVRSARRESLVGDSAAAKARCKALFQKAAKSAMAALLAKPSSNKYS